MCWRKQEHDKSDLHGSCANKLISSKNLHWNVLRCSSKKKWLKQGLSPGLQDNRPAHKPLSHEDMLIPSASFFHFTELATSCEQ
jgi:hypothetical protein